MEEVLKVGSSKVVASRMESSIGPRLVGHALNMSFSTLSFINPLIKATKRNTKLSTMTIDTLHGLPLKPAELFGGAITTVIPESFVDASNFREVPDNQEVFVSMSDDDGDVSIIVDILERVELEGAVSEGDEDMKAMEVHFSDVLAERSGKAWGAPQKIVLEGL